MVFQLQLTKNQQVLPTTRDYSHTTEWKRRSRDGRLPRESMHRTGSSQP
jgi:hypothetical protein